LHDAALVNSGTAVGTFPYREREWATGDKLTEIFAWRRAGDQAKLSQNQQSTEETRDAAKT
jgi:hypothetical protein